ncbi:MAG: hypothetical protein LAQ69_18710 [Acidobacteriia bacterium]|nr:hypothetical protein [Terriglobia bacterium]
MRALWLSVLVSVIGTAQTPPPALLRGVLLERDTPNTSGEFSVRAPDNQVFRYQFDPKTYVERENQMIDVRRLQPGEKLEVVSDTVPGSVLRYARTIHVLQDPPPPRAITAGRLRAYRTPTEHMPTGTLTYSGVVFRLTGERLVLHTREGGDQAILLRKDTRFLENGEIVEAANLKPNMRVFVRAGKDLYDQVEAYQVIWGKILDPQ